jgi:hypothetical protein
MEVLWSSDVEGAGSTPAAIAKKLGDIEVKM